MQKYGKFIIYICVLLLLQSYYTQEDLFDFSLIDHKLDFCGFVRVYKLKKKIIYLFNYFDISKIKLDNFWLVCL